LIPVEKLNEYTEAFLKITEQTGVKDIDELVKNFIEAEERVGKKTNALRTLLFLDL
jgi:hypothetical protein